MRTKKQKSGKQIERNRRAIELIESYHKAGWTNTTISKHCDVDLSTIRRWFEGSSPNIPTLRRLETIQTAIDRQKKIAEKDQERTDWFEAGGFERIDKWKEWTTQRDMSKMNDEEVKYFFKEMSHESDGFFLGFISYDERVKF